MDGDLGTAWLGDRFLAPQRRHLDITVRRAARACRTSTCCPYSDARGITRNVIVNGRLFPVHAGWNRLKLGIPSHGQR